RLCEFTNVASSGGTSTGTSYQHGDHGQRSSSTSTTHSENWQQHGRRLYRPEELMALPERIAISFTPGVPPIRTRLIRYFEGDFRRGRLGRAWAGFRMFVASAAVLLFVALIAISIVAGAASNHSNKPPYSAPLQGFNNNPFERR